MPVVSVLAKLFYHLPFTHDSGWHPELDRAHLDEADLTNTILSGANFEHAILNEANLSGANIQDTNLLIGTQIYHAKGLTEHQRAHCQENGAILDPPPHEPDMTVEIK